MRRILPLIAILLLCAGAMCIALSLGSVAPPHFKSAHAQLSLTGAGAGAPGGGGGGESYSFIGSADKADLTDTEIFTMSVPADYVVVLVSSQNGSFVSVTVGATTLNKDIPNTGTAAAIYSGAVATPSSTVTVVTSGGTGGDRIIAVYVISNIVTASVKHTEQCTCGSGTINVTGGDYLFAISPNDVAFGTSTETAANKCSPDCTVTGVNTTTAFSDWTVISTNASFSIGLASFQYLTAASYH